MYKDSYGRGLAGTEESDYWGDTSSVFDTGGGATTNISVFNKDEENARINEVTGAGRQHVKQIQGRLRDMGFPPADGKYDGIWGKNTCKAITDFQKKLWGDAKGGYLDAETFMKLGFDSTMADMFEKEYGPVCGGAVPPGGRSIVGPDQIKQIQISLGVAQTGTWDSATCRALYSIQQRNGNYSQRLVESTFISLGIPRPTATLFSISFASACVPWYVGKTDQPKTPSGPGTPKPKPQPKKEIEPQPKPKPVKAGISPWVIGVIAGGLLVGALVMRKRSRKGR